MVNQLGLGDHFYFFHSIKIFKITKKNTYIFWSYKLVPDFPTLVHRFLLCLAWNKDYITDYWG